MSNLNQSFGGYSSK